MHGLVIAGQAYQDHQADRGGEAADDAGRDGHAEHGTPR